jgi:RNA polymerase sigma factor (sigma-70 family)
MSIEADRYQPRPATSQGDAMSQDDTKTTELIARIRSGDREAWSRLVERELPQLRRFAKGRLPLFARGALDTQDLVHDVLLRAMPRLDSWEGNRPGALQAFLRRAVANQIVDEIRKARRRVASTAPIESHPDSGPSALAQVISREDRMRLRAALENVSASDRALLGAPFGWGLRYADVAARVRRPTANAARVAVERAVARVAKAMRKPHSPVRKVQ